MAKISGQKGQVLRIIQPTTTNSDATLGVYDSHPPLARYVW